MLSGEIQIAELEEFALELANTAGGIAKAYFRRSFTIENKEVGGFDPVTSADRAIEAALRDAVVSRYPEHGIVAEEGAARGSQSPYTWFIDPIDGTRAFMMGSPLWGTLVGLTHNEMPLLGLLGQPVLDEVFFGSPAGSWLITANGRQRLQSRDCGALSNAALACTHPDLFDSETRVAFDALARQCLLHRFGGDCYNYAMLAAGFVDLVVEGQLNSYDIVPLIPVIEGAGGVISDWEGEPPLNGGYVVAAATAELHRQALEVLNNTFL